MRKFFYTNGAQGAPFLTYTLLLSHLIHADGDHRFDSEFTRIAIIPMPRTRKAHAFHDEFSHRREPHSSWRQRNRLRSMTEVRRVFRPRRRATPTLQQARHARV